MFAFVKVERHKPGCSTLARISGIVGDYIDRCINVTQVVVSGKKNVT